MSTVSVHDETMSVSSGSDNEDTDDDFTDKNCQPWSSEKEISVNGQPENGNETSLKEFVPDEMPLEKADVQLTKVMKSLNESIAKTDDPKRMDENELYAMSLANRLRQLDRRQKAIVRNSIEKIFLDIELGYYNMPQQGSFMQVTMPQGSENSNMFWPSQNLNA